mmetsp:Transcript_105444/g.304392  ORF Transcript_105444/g.304392 Transcript_105444/m.304392 type:complete len:129 (-) Transcript_105444:3049-3435(-)
MRVLGILVGLLSTSVAVAFAPSTPPQTRWTPVCSTGRPGDNGPMCGERNPAFKFFTEDAPWKKAAAEKRAAAAGVTTTKAAPSKARRGKAVAAAAAVEEEEEERWPCRCPPIFRAPNFACRASAVGKR